MDTAVATPAAADPETLADVRHHGVYRLKVAARLVGVHPDTFQAHAAPGGFLPKTARNSPVRVWGHEILRQAGVKEIERAGRAGERGETERQRAKRVETATAELLRMLG